MIRNQESCNDSSKFLEIVKSNYTHTVFFFFSFLFLTRIIICDSWLVYSVWWRATVAHDALLPDSYFRLYHSLDHRLGAHEIFLRLSCVANFVSDLVKVTFPRKSFSSNNELVTQRISFDLYFQASITMVLVVPRPSMLQHDRTRSLNFSNSDIWRWLHGGHDER